MEEIRKKLKDIHDEVPPDYYDTSMRENLFQRFWHTERIKALTELLMGTDALLLDIGCGGGTLLDLISQRAGLKRTVGIDASTGAIAYAYAHHRVDGYPKFLCADFYELPFEDSAFGAISAIEVLEHLHDPKGALLELNRCLKKNGMILILVPNENNILFRIIWWFWTKGKGKVWKEAHVQKFTEGSLEALLNSAGFRVTRKKKFLLGMLMAMKGVKD